MNTKNGGSLQNFGLEPGQENDKIKAVGLDTYTEMLAEANAETNETTRYEKYAEAQAWLIDSGLTMPNLSLGGTPSVTKTVPFSRSYSLVGIKGASSSYFKYVKLQDKIVTTKEYESAKKKWLKEKEISNKKAQDDYENHVK